MHGHAGPPASPTYQSWIAMIQRCKGTARACYAQYGGRGIRVCDRWLTFVNFLADMGERPSKAHSIDRIDNDGNYEPGNCRWATRVVQNRNRSIVRPIIRSDGQRFRSSTEAEEKTGAPSNQIRSTCVGRQKTCRGFGWRYADV